MIYAPELDKATARLTDRPALQLVHQAAGGEFVASDGLIMLIDAGSATSCLSPCWRLQMPVTLPASPEPLVSWQAVLLRMQGGRYIWYNLPELQQAGKTSNKIIKGPWV